MYREAFNVKISNTTNKWLTIECNHVYTPTSDFKMIQKQVTFITNSSTYDIIRKCI